MKINVYFIIFLTIILLLSSNITAEEDDMYFQKAGIIEIEKTNVTYVNEKELYLRIIFGNNCSHYTLEGKSPLFLHPIFDMDNEKVVAGKIIEYPLNINPNAEVGKYLVIVYLNYTNENNIKVSNQFNLTITYNKSFEITELKLPTDSDRTFSLDIRTFVEFTKFKVMFDKDGDIVFDQQEFILENISIGNYTFKSKVFQFKSSFIDLNWGSQEVGYDIIGKIENRTVRKYDANIPVKITWNSENKEEELRYQSISIGAIIILVIVIIIGIFYYRSKKKKIIK